MNTPIGLNDACVIKNLLCDNRLLGPCVSAGHLVITELNLPSGIEVNELVSVLRASSGIEPPAALEFVPECVRKYPNGSLKMDLRFGSREDASTFAGIARASALAPSESLTAAMNVVGSLSQAGILRAPVSILQEIIVEVTLDSSKGMSRADCVLLVKNGSPDSQTPECDLLASSVQTKEDGTLVLRLLMLTPLEASLLRAVATRLCENKDIAAI